METTKRLVCLANSRKHHGRCVAGIDMASNTWVRPISDRTGHEVAEHERRYGNGAEPRVLDVIEMRLVERRRSGFQRENWLIDSTARWKRAGRVAWDDLRHLEQRPQRLWINNGDSTKRGLNDRVSVAQADGLTDSLKLIRVDSVTIAVAPAYDPSKRFEVRAEFRYSGFAYILKMTDCVYEEKFKGKGVGRYRLGESFLTVSLGEEWCGYYYKMVAAIIERREVRSGGG
ncbi:hypothetical protein GPA10_05950 [Streptomyces sp. p1417]|uniref:Dual OB-containing domain-containing protein n=1 Tax=Streptomyces typhae TaxID=2681492 RepID=A0A6L6WRK2_9ACTN|nr:hypothetical protein [Streptomyces typhae]MVO84327.1 hypothetical protein [Streptomyces typhae]